MVTLHAPLGKAIANELLERIDTALRETMQAKAVWTTMCEDSTNLVVMAEVEVPDR